MKSSIYLVILFLAVTFPALSDVIEVPGRYHTIQGAINAAREGDTIIVKPGTYRENLELYGKNIILRSTDPLDPAIVNDTVIHGRNMASCITFEGSENESFILSGFTITGGYALRGGGINGRGSRATIQYCHITTNTSYGSYPNGWAGGIGNVHGIIRSCLISDNRAEVGGGLDTCNGIIRYNTIAGNEVTYYGGGLYRCDADILHNTISGNTAQRGGGLSECEGTIEGNVVSKNHALEVEGGIQECEGIIRGNIVSENTADQEGGGLYRCFADTENNFILQNKAPMGGGISFSNGKIRNNVVLGNIAEHDGGGIYNSCNWQGYIANCIIRENRAIAGPQVYKSFLPVYSCIQDWPPDDRENISVDPQFRNAEKHDFHLTKDSPCIDSGDIIEDLFLDFDGFPRLAGKSFDMGPYEFASYPLLVQITPHGDVWGAVCRDIPPLHDPARMGWLGFRYDPIGGWLPLAGDPDGDGDQDLIQITTGNDVWVSLYEGEKFQDPTRWRWIGFRHNDGNGDRGETVLAGDVDGDLRDDLIQVTKYGDVWVSLSSGNQYELARRWGWPGFSFHRGGPGTAGELPLAGDFNNDGKTDLCQLTRYGDVWVSLSSGTDFQSPTRWGWPGFFFTPMDGFHPLCGDVNGDGTADLVQITPHGEVWTSLSLGYRFRFPERWGTPWIYYDELQGYLPILNDVNADGRCDLIQLTPGVVRVSLSNGTGFEPSEDWGHPGFTFDRAGKAGPFYLR